MKKSKIILIALGALLLVGALVFGILMLNQSADKDQKPVDQSITLYWNVERADYAGGAFTRSPRGDGYFYVRFAVGGEQVDIPVANEELIHKVDHLDVMGLVFNEDGVAIDVKNINECTGGLVANVLYVKSIDGNTVHCNNQGMYKGQAFDLELTENTQIYDVGQQGLLCGISSQIAEDDELMAIQDYDGNLIYIYRKAYQEPGDVYWNLERKYDSTNRITTRPYDSLGTYEFKMALNGEVVTVRTRDMAIANAIDAKAAKCTGLEFDEDGFVCRVNSATAAANGSGTFASWAHVFETDGTNVYAVKLSGSTMGTEYEAPLAKNAKIINVSGIGGELGSYTTIQYGDQIHGILDKRGRICYAWVVSRLAGDDGYKLYWNVERKFDKTLSETTRTPSADGYYYIDVATDGQVITVKTQDKEMATKLDSYAARCFSMKITEDNEIVAFASAGAIHGGATFGSWYYVDKIDGQNVTVSRVLTGDTEPTVLEGVMAKDIQVINGSLFYTNNPGEYTTLQVGDRVHGLKNLDGEVAVLFVVDRAPNVPIYWNLVRKYDSKEKVSTRVPAADGYYYFDMAVNGKQVTVKTNDKEMARKIDAAAARCVGLLVDKNGVVQKFFGASTVEGYQGGTKHQSWVDVKKISGNTFTAQKDPKSTADTAGQYFTSTMAANCKVYNVSSNYKQFAGEVTTLRVGDRIHALHNKDGLATIVFVVERAKILDEKDPCPCKSNVKWQPWNGKTPLENGKSYYLTQDVVAPDEGFLMDGLTVNLRLDGHTISSKGRCFYVKSSAKLNICDHTTRGKLIGNGVADQSGGVIRVSSSSCVVNLWNIDVVGGSAPVAKEGGLISCSGTVSLYDCNLSNGTATSKSGNIQLNSGGTLRVFGGTIANGSAPSAANVNASGRMYMENVSVIGGGAFTCNSEKEVVINGLTAENVFITKHQVTFKGNMQLKKLTLRDDTSIVDGGIYPDSNILLVCKPEKSQVVMTSATQAGYKALTSFDPDDYVLSYNSAKKTVTVTNTIVPQSHNNTHCACAGVAKGVGEHTCKELTKWTKLTKETLVDSPTSGNLAFPASGNYYLSMDLELTKSIDILPGQEITLCLNSCELTSTKRIFRINGTLNVTDCQNKGELIGKAALAPVFYTYAGGTFNLFAGTVSTIYEGAASYWGGIGYLSNDAGNATEKAPSTMNMYGGTIWGGYVTRNAEGKYGQGGALIVATPNTFNMYGGLIRNGGAEVRGGNVFVSGAAKINLLGGAIQGGYAPIGSDIYLDTTTKTTLGGELQIGEAYLAGGTVKLQDLDEDSYIGIRMSDPGAFAESEKDLTQCFHSLDSGYYVTYKNGEMVLRQPIPEGAHAHCFCGDTALNAYNHECDRMAYEPWTATNSLPTESGNYYLTGDVVLEDLQSGLKVGTKKINICLNGYNITNENGRVFYLDGAGAVNVCNCDTTKGGVISGTGVEGESGGLVRVSLSSGKFGAYNVTLRRIDTETRTGVTEGGVINCSGYLWLYNTKVENGYATKGGNVNLVLTSKAQIVGCTISGGEAVKDANKANGTGGNIRVSGNNADNPASLIMMDTTLIGGKAQSSGAALFMGSATTTSVTMGGKITTDGNVRMDSAENLHMQGLSQDSVIVLQMKNAGVIGTTDADVSACFRSKNTGMKVYYDAQQGVLYMTEDQDAHAHCICGNTAEGAYEHSCERVFYSEWTSDHSLPTESGNYYLTCDVVLEDLASGLKVGTKKINICLNGYNITNENGRVFYLDGAGAVNVCNCDTTKGGVIGATGVAGESGGVVRVSLSSGKFGAYNVTLRRIDTETRTAVTEGGVINCSGSLWLYNAKVENGYATKGGNVNLVLTSKAKIVGCTISGGEVVKDANNANGTGGNIRVSGNNADNPASLILMDTTLIGGKAQSSGAALFMGSATTTSVTMGGKITTDGIVRMDSMENLHMQNLSADSVILLQMKNAGVIGTTNADVAGCFESKNSGMKIYYDAQQGLLYMAEDKDLHAHCLCGGTAVDMHEHSCGRELYTAWTSTNSLPTESGSYYLTDNVVLEDLQSGLKVGTNQINICLNGYNITNENGRVFYLNGSGSVNVCNCDTAKGGVIGATGVAGESGGVVRLSLSTGTFNAYNVTLRRIDTDTRTAVTEGGLIQSSGNLRLYGCNLENGYSFKGGNVNISATSKVVIVGCTISGGHAAKDANNANGTGGNLRIAGNNTSNKATLLVKDTTITDSYAQSGGAGLYVGSDTNTQVTLSGTVTMDGVLYMAGNGNLDVKALSADSAIRLSMANPGVIGAASSDLTACIISNASGKNVYYDATAGELYLAESPREEEPEPEPEDPAQGQHKHCVCAGAQAMPKEPAHTCQDVLWTGLTQDMFDNATDSTSPVKLTNDGYLLDDGYYYLSEDITIAKSIISTVDMTMALCLNGKNLHSETRTLYFQGTLHLCDCDYTDVTEENTTVRTYQGSVTSDSKAHAHIFYARSGANFYFYGGNLIGHGVGSSYTSNSGTGTVGGKMYMYGGVIRDGDTTANKKGGGNLRVDGTFEMYAGLIAGGKANEGGNISISSAGSAVIQGGCVENGQAVSGGNIAAFGALTVSGDAVIRGGVSTGTSAGNGGGNIYGYPNKTNIQITGGQILNGQAAKFGANIYVRGNSNGTNVATLSITGGQVSGVSDKSASGITSVYLHTNKGILNVYVGGDAKVDEIRMDAEGMLQLAEEGITDEASVGVSLTTGNGKVISSVNVSAEVDYTKIFQAITSDKTIQVVDGALVITEA